MEALIEQAKTAGLPDEALLVEVEDIASLLREVLDAAPRAPLRPQLGYLG